MDTIKPVVAGMFYPANPNLLREMIDKFLANAKHFADLSPPKAIIAPHAGYIYSGPVAASAYTCLQNVKSKINRIIVLAPSHHYPLSGIAVTSATQYLTPFASIKIDQPKIHEILALPEVNLIDDAFLEEHAIEVHLPFLQTVLENFTLVPILVGHANAEATAIVMEQLWGDKETLIVVSSDLSHYHDYETARTLDRKTAEAIVALQPKSLHPEGACGYFPVIGLLTVAKRKKLTASLIDLRNSGDTAGTKDAVVGYGAFHFLED